MILEQNSALMVKLQLMERTSYALRVTNVKLHETLFRLQKRSLLTLPRAAPNASHACIPHTVLCIHWKSFRSTHESYDTDIKPSLGPTFIILAFISAADE
jgi:hypothetical protein